MANKKRIGDYFKRGKQTSATNPNMEVFNELNDDIDLDELAVTSANNGDMGDMSYDIRDHYYRQVYAPLSTNKQARLRTYRVMSRYPEVLECLEHIADDSWIRDENDKYSLIKFNQYNKKLTDNQKKVINEEWDSYIGLFDLDKNGFKYTKTFLYDGELAWENIIDPKHPDAGIVGINYLPTDQYEFLRDLVKNKNIGIMFQKQEANTNTCLSSSYNASINTFQNADTNSNSASYSSMMLGDSYVPLLFSQLTYINTGDYDHEEKIVYPLLDRCRESYYQLSLMHDAAVILRVVRAPERLVFNIDVGKMPDKKAKMKVRQFINSMTSKKTANGNGEKRNKYDPHSMLESYYFWKSSEGGGTQVESLGSTAVYDQMDDVEYFLKRLYKALKVPFSRWQQAENTMERDETITYEEYAFTKFIIRIQRMFATGFNDGFITHLKLRGLWDKFKLSKADVVVEFTRPVLYDLYQEQKLLQIKMENYELQADREEFSSEMAMRDILGWTHEKIDENRELVRKELLEEAIITNWTDKIEEFGPKDIVPPVAWNEEEVDDEDM